MNWTESLKSTQTQETRNGFNVARVLAANAHPLENSADIDPLVAQLGRGKLVILGAADRGTHEYLRWQSILTRRLIEEHGFGFVAFENDWASFTGINTYVHVASEKTSATAALTPVRTWPAWTVANWELVAFTEWLADYNRKKAPASQVGLYGLDRYNHWSSLETIRQYRAQRLASSAGAPAQPTGDDETLIHLLAERNRLQKKSTTQQQWLPDAHFTAVSQSNAEKYYRFKLRGGPQAWNLREEDMTQFLQLLLMQHGPEARGIVWTHNLHASDSRGTSIRMKEMVSLGARCREMLGRDKVKLVGMSGGSGVFLSARTTGGPAATQRWQANELTWEASLRESGASSKWLFTADINQQELQNQEFTQRSMPAPVASALPTARSISGIIPFQYDAFVYFDRTHPLFPLHMTADGLTFPESYPFGI